MNKIWLIASTEFTLIVRTKAFLFGLFLLPMVTVAVVLLSSQLAKEPYQPINQEAAQRLTAPFRVLIVDYDSGLTEPLRARVDDYNHKNLLLQNTALDLQIVSSPTKERAAILRDLNDSLAAQKIDAYMLLPSDALDASALDWSVRSPDGRFLSWFQAALNEIIKEKRLIQAGLTQDQRDELSRVLQLAPKVLLPQQKEEATGPSQLVEVLNFIVPSVMVFLLFTLVMMSIQPLITTALEEKMSRISEVLLGMVDPFTLMMGKLIGSLGASFLVAVFYVGTGLVMLYVEGYLSLVPLASFGYLLLFLFPALFFFGSLYLAVGAACSDVKDAQALLTPFMLVLMMPLFLLPFLLREPDGAISTALSFFPASAPFVMLMRTSLEPGPPVWQLVLSVVVTFVATGLFVIAAGRVFRAGLLMQGKPPSLREFLKWSLR